jgi:flavin reductase (DIM6/NTAB) family NADH-FMN oxidoreductase RutF
MRTVLQFLPWLTVVDDSASCYRDFCLCRDLTKIVIMPTPSPADVIKLIDREVWIVTAQATVVPNQPDAGEVKPMHRGGLLATWVSQASLDADDPVMVIGLSPNHFTAELIDASRSFALHLLRQDQAQLGLNFALGSGRDRDKFDGLETISVKTGSPILADCLAWLDCRVTDRIDHGDRIYYWASVEAAMKNTSDGQVSTPLREQGLIAAATDAQKKQLRENLLFDLEFQQKRINK